jgi:hypothetical protein
MTQGFDEQIEELSARLEAYKPRLADACARWLDVVAPWLAQRWDDTARDIVTGQPNVAKQVQAQGALTRARGEINDLVANAREVSEELIVRKHQDRWPHLVESPDWWMTERGTANWSELHVFIDTSGRRTGGIRAPGPLEEPIGQALIRAAELLQPYGFEVSTRAITGWRAELPIDVADALNEYADLHKQAIEVGASLEHVRAEKARTEAADLWDQ